MTTASNKQALTVIVLIIAGLLSIGTSFFGFMTLGIGEACCHTNEPGGRAYFAFAASLTSSLAVFILYAVWAPAKPMIMWLWSIAIITALETMTFVTYDPAKSTIHNPLLIFLSELEIPQVWLPIGISALCQVEAIAGSRTGQSNLEVLT